jgi:hypothetical protein
MVQVVPFRVLTPGIMLMQDMAVKTHGFLIKSKDFFFAL